MEIQFSILCFDTFLHTFLTVLLIHWTVVAMSIITLVCLFLYFIYLFIHSHFIFCLLKKNVMCETRHWALLHPQIISKATVHIFEKDGASGMLEWTDNKLHFIQIIFSHCTLFLIPAQCLYFTS